MMEMTIDWSRCIHITRSIDEDLLNELVPKVLTLRQQSNEAITVGLNSPGGMVSLLPIIRSLVREPNQDGATCELVTVATHKAFSAAAMLLAMGDYAVALPHAEVLFHDVRYGNVRDVTPASAMKAAESLEAGNDRASLQIADHMFARWMWMYLDIHSRASALRTELPEQTRVFEEAVKHLNMPKCDYIQLDLVGLMLFIHKHLRADNECILVNALEKLSRWGAVSSFANQPMYRSRGSRRPGMLDGIARLYKDLHPKSELLGGRENESDLNLFMTVLALSLKGRSAKAAVNLAAREMNLFSSMNNPRHWQTAMRLMLRHKFTFFRYDIVKKWEELSEDERNTIANESSPVVRVIWLLCVQVARELFSGEHRLLPREALVLGLVDEAPGNNVFESRREFARRPAQSQGIASS